MIGWLPAPAGIILYAMVYGYYPFNPADPKLPKKMMEVSTPTDRSIDAQCWVCMV